MPDAQGRLCCPQRSCGLKAVSMARKRVGCPAAALPSTSLLSPQQLVWGACCQKPLLLIHSQGWGMLAPLLLLLWLLGTLALCCTLAGWDLLWSLCVSLCSAGPCSLPVIHCGVLVPVAPKLQGLGVGLRIFLLYLPRWHHPSASPATAVLWLPAPGSPLGDVALHKRCLAGISSTV